MTLDKNTFPYNEDFSENKQFYQIMFVPGRAVQARELSQLQSVLQNQISRFGKHVFKEGSMVIPGEMSVDLAFPYVKLKDTFASNEVNLANFENKKIVGLTSGAIAKVVRVENATGADPKTLYVQYESGASSLVTTGSITSSSFVVTSIGVSATEKLKIGTKVTGTGIPSGTIITEIISSSQVRLSNQATVTNGSASLTFSSAVVFANNEQIRTIDTNIAFPVFQAETATSAATGLGSRAIIKPGVYFIFGYFCFINEQTLLLEKYDNTPSYRVGIRALESFVNSTDDISLLDPAQGSPNFNAPGADRYKIELILSKFALDADVQDNFIELLNIQDGIIQKLIENSRYSELDKTLARRTYDESGNYTVKPFPIEYREHLDTGTNRGVYSASNGGDESKFVIGLEPGKAYVSGFELENKATVRVENTKARTTKVSSGLVTPYDLGSSVEITNVSGLFNITTNQSVNLVGIVKGGGGYPGSTMGTAKVRGIQFLSGTPGTAGARYRLYLYDIAMSGINKFEDIKGLRSTASLNCDVVLIAGNAYIENSQQASALLSLPYRACKTLKDEFSNIDTIYTTKKYATGTMTGSTLVLSAGSSEIFEPYSVTNYMVAVTSPSGTATGNGFSAGSIINLAAVGNSVVLGGAPVGKQVTITIPSIAGSGIEVIASVTKSGVQEKTKTKTTRVQTLAHAPIIQLDKADIFRLVSVIDDVTSQNITAKYILDNGQRDSYYDRGRLLFKAENVVPTGNVTITYEYFAHGAGDFFSVDSYFTTIPYADIGTYVASNGTIYDLRNTIDFRPRIADAGGSYSVIGDMLAPGETFITDLEFYLPRYDLVSLSSFGEFKVTNGISSENPTKPTTPADSMALYELYIPEYTFSLTDIQTKRIENKRYTMRDIGKLEQRIENIEYYTSLSLLEKETSDLFIDDGAGNNRFKNGFIVDNFTSHLVGDLKLTEYQCSVDKTNQILRPMFASKNVGLDFISGDSSNYTKTGDLITLPYTTEVFINQRFASKTENINPYDVFNWTGNVVLTPESDEWYEESQAPDRIVTVDDGSAQFDGQIIWNDWQTDWIGETVVSSTLLSFEQQSRGRNQFRQLRQEEQLISSESGQSRTGSSLRVIQHTSTEVVDNKVISEATIPWIRTKLVSFIAKNLKPNTRVYPFFDATSVSTYVRPAGGTYGDSLIADISGEILGEFNIPNDDVLKFRTGDRVFRLTDSPSDDRDNTTTTAEGRYRATGILRENEQTILSTRTGTVISTPVTDSRVVVDQSLRQVTVDTGWYDPLAQTFLIEKEGGVFLNKIDIFFATKDTKGVPVTLQIRTTVNGYPGGTIIPFSEVTLKPSDVTVSENGTSATSFVFPSPVYLQDGTEYCFVLLANSIEYTIWCSRLGEFDVSTGERISQQPYAGVMFKSQNASTWTADQEQDIKFTIHRCVFNTAVMGTAIFKNVALDTVKLSVNPFSTTNTSTTVLVYHANHGLISTGLVTLSGATGTLNGIPSAQLNTQHTVTVVDIDYYTIIVAASATSTGITGGTDIRAGFNIKTDVMCPTLETMILPSTEINWGLKVTNPAKSLPTAYANIQLKENIEFTDDRLIFGTDNAPVGGSSNLRAQFISDVDNVSPVIDTQRMSLICVSNRINNLSTNELLAGSGDAIARYITKKITLATPATGARVYFAADRPSDCQIKVFIKTRKDSDTISEFESLEYQELTPIVYPLGQKDIQKDYTFELIGLDPYSLFSIKIVMSSGTTYSVPKIKDFRAIAIT